MKKRIFQKHLKPDGAPLNVSCKLYLMNIQKVDDEDMKISLEIIFR